MPDHSRRAVSLRLLAQSWASFLVPDALVQDQPDQAAQPVGDQADRLRVPEPGPRAAIEELEEGAFGFHRGSGRLVEQAPHLPVALRGAVPAPRTERSRRWGPPRPGSAAPSPPEPGHLGQPLDRVLVRAQQLGDLLVEAEDLAVEELPA